MQRSWLAGGGAGLALLAGLAQAGLGSGGCSDGGTGAGGSGGAGTSSSTGSGGAGGVGAGVAFENPRVCDPAVNGSGCTQDQLAHGRRVLADLKAGADTRMLPAADATTGADVGEAAFDVSLYNGLLPGPTLDLQVGAPGVDGDTLQVKLTNTGKLDVCCCPLVGECPMECHGNAPGSCVRWNGETNMHTHGFHIASTSVAHGTSDPCIYKDTATSDLPWDDVFVSVPATTTTLDPCMGTPDPSCTITNVQQFSYPLPPHQAVSDFQPVPITKPHWFGLQWYHPHMHMTSYDQVGRGMAGAMVIRHPVEDTLPALQGVSKDGDRIFMLQRLSSNDGSKVARLVNGRRGQVLTIKPGETQRWRILDAAADNSIRFSVKDSGGAEIPYYPIGYDGIPMATVGAAVQSYLLQAGNRLEVLFRAPATAKDGDTYQVTWCEPKVNSSFQPVDPLGPDQPCTGPTESVVTVKVEGAAVTPAPATLAGSALASLDTFGLVPDLWAAGTKIDATHTIKFEQDTSGAMPMFTIDGVPFEMDQACNPPFAVNLGETHEWTLENWTGEVHTFHIHVNPFQAEPAAGAAPYYQDTILLTPPVVPTGGTVTVPTQVKVRMKFVDYPGTAVFHCHVLFHEDNGMMAAFKVNP